MDYRVDISDLANIDIDNALARLRRHSGTAAEMWFGDLLEAIGSLERMPNRCPIAPETRSFFIESGI